MYVDLLYNKLNLNFQITFFIGLLLNEVLNMILKYTIREARPLRRQINYTEFGMPSSHSQLMWYFAIYSVYFTIFRYIILTCHHKRRSNKPSTNKVCLCRLHGYPGKSFLRNQSHKIGIIATVIATAAFVTYSR